MQIAELFVVHVEPVVGPEHDDRDIRRLMRDEMLDRAEPFTLPMHQRRAGMGAVEDAETGVVEQHALQPAGDALGLAVAEYGDPQRRRQVGVLRLGRAGARRGDHEDRHDRRPEKPTESTHGSLTPRHCTAEPR